MSGPQGNNPLAVISKSSTSITSTTTFTTRFNVDMEGFADGVIVIRNDDASISLRYRIYAAAAETDSLQADGSDTWVNILDKSDDPIDYDHNKFKTIPASTTFYESISNKFRWHRIMFQAVSGTVNTKVWFRSRNIK